MNTKNIRHEVIIEAATEKVFNAIMDEQQHSEYTGCSATISNQEGGRFSACSDKTFGYTIKLIPHSRIIQAWSHESFPDNHFSIIDFRLEKIDRGTKVTFDQFGAPQEFYEWLNEGWISTYWVPLKEYLEKKKEI
ncbi:MAG: SRPBCC domain-containing protein [Bacteroidetes bacterium]|nr:SRPBCC domain-containing protein [Bacteroidota bacterium]MBU1677544.1 SRPBCC domain-containing protein [Bacteroidota bacterium]MBU2505589.1 SRPBCC domain-containing protein [Bacteroidota bacterium]